MNARVAGAALAAALVAGCVFPQDIGTPCPDGTAKGVCPNGSGCFLLDAADPSSEKACLPPRDLSITSCAVDDDCVAKGYPLGAVCDGATATPPVAGTCQCDGDAISCDVTVDPISCACSSA